MAQRYGGRYSPDSKGDGPVTPAQAAPQRKRSRAGARINLLFFAPLSLAVAAFRAEPTGMAMYLVALGLLLLAAWMTREGVIAQDAYDARKIARKPAFPRKSAGSLLTGLGLLLAGLAGDNGLGTAALFGVLGTVLHGLAFGLDPMKDKGIEGIDDFQTDRVARAVENAEETLKSMMGAVERGGDREVIRRTEKFQDTARAMFRTIEEDPRDLTAARKYIGVYLGGARDAAVKFADLYSRRPTPEVKSDFMAFLDDLDQNFAARTETLLVDDKSQLDIEIEVLRDRLRREGLVTQQNGEPT
ncbi:MAG: 5-bromo-4-chloroindolyl phosphate hydrolysis family protein [Pseudomonadota bacterium]